MTAQSRARNGRADKVRAFLTTSPGAAFAAIHAHIGEGDAHPLRKTLVQLRQQGYLAIRDGGYWYTGKQPSNRRYATHEERLEAKREARRRYNEAQGIPSRRRFATDEERREAAAEKSRRHRAKRRAQRAESAAPKPSRRIDRNTIVRRQADQRVVIAAEKRETGQVSVPLAVKPAFPDTETFIRANPDKFEVYPLGYITEARPVLDARERRQLATFDDRRRKA